MFFGGFFYYLWHCFLLVLYRTNLIVDILLVVHIRKDLKKKALFSVSDSGKSKADLEKRQKEKKSTERKTNKLIVYQIIMYVFCRLPELVYYIHFAFFLKGDAIDTVSMEYFRLCSSFNLCLLASNVIQYLYALTYIFSVYFFYKFNKNFKLATKEYFFSKFYSRCVGKSRTLS